MPSHRPRSRTVTAPASGVALAPPPRRTSPHGKGNELSPHRTHASWRHTPRLQRRSGTLGTQAPGTSLSMEAPVPERASRWPPTTARSIVWCGDHIAIRLASTSTYRWRRVLRPPMAQAPKAHPFASTADLSFDARKGQALLMPRPTPPRRPLDASVPLRTNAPEPRVDPPPRADSAWLGPE